MYEMNTALRLAIIETGQFQYQIGEQAGIHEARLTRIVRGRARPSERERLALSGVLGKDEGALFAEAPQKA